MNGTASSVAISPAHELVHDGRAGGMLLISVVVIASVLVCAGVSWVVRKFFRNPPASGALVPHDEEAANEDDSHKLALIHNSSSREVSTRRGVSTRIAIPGTGYSMVHRLPELPSIPSMHTLSPPSVLTEWTHRCCGPVVGLCSRLLQPLNHYCNSLMARHLPNDRKEVVMLVLTAMLFYCDILSGVIIAVLFYVQGLYGYVVWTLIAISSTFFRARLAGEGMADFALLPGRLAWKGLELAPSAAALKPVWTNQELSESTRRLQELSSLRSQMWAVTRLEAEAQAPMNTLLQLYVIFHENEHHNWLIIAILACSAAVGFLSLLRTLHSFDERGHTMWTMPTRIAIPSENGAAGSWFVGHTRYKRGEAFSYVAGVGVTPGQSVFILLFRFLEVASRIGTLATAQALLRGAYPQDFGNHLVMPTLLAFSVLGLFAAEGMQHKPHYREACLLGAFCFPGPLLLPPYVKTSVVSLAIFYLIRVSETVVPWILMCSAVLMGWVPPLDFRDNLLLGVAGFLALSFCLAAPVAIRWAQQHDHATLRMQLASQFGVDAKGRIVWPEPEDGGDHLSQILQGYGFVVHGADEDEAAEEEEEKTDAWKDEPWCHNPKTSADLDAQNIVFTPDSGLCDETAADTERVFVAAGHEIRRVRFEDSFLSSMSESMSEYGWRKVLESLAKSTRTASNVIELAFCGIGKGSLLDGVMAESIADHLTYFPNLSTLDLSGNREIGVAGWHSLFDAVRGGQIEDLVISNCDLDEAKCEEIAKGLNKLEDLKKLDLSDNAIRGPGWVSLFTAINSTAQLKELRLQKLQLNADKVDGLAQLVPHLRSLEIVDLSRNPNVEATPWKNLLSAFASTPIHTLHLQGCLHDDAAEVIARGIEEFRRLEKLHLSRNDQLSAGAWRRFMHVLSGTELRQLWLDHCSFNDSEIEQVMQTLPSFKRLWKLDFSYNDKVTAHMWRHLTESEALRLIDITGCTLTRNIRTDLVAAWSTRPIRVRLLNDPPLESGLEGEPCASEGNQVHTVKLDLNNYSEKSAMCALAQLHFIEELYAAFTTEHVAALGVMMTHSSNLRTLDLTGSALTIGGWQNLFAVLDGTNIQELSLQQCGLDEFKAQAMAEVQPEMSCLRRVNLEGNDLTPACITPLLQSFGRTSAEELGNIFSSMDEAKATAVAAGLHYLRALKRIDLSMNAHISADLWKQLIGALASMEIEELRVDYCKLDDEKADAMAAELSKLKLGFLKKFIVMGSDEATNPTLIVGVVGASGLHQLDPGKCDPYCICRIKQKERFRTHTIADSMSPAWKVEHRIPNFAETDHVEFLVVDCSYGKGKDQVLGQAMIPILSCMPDGFNGKLDLHNSKKKRRSMDISPSAHHGEMKVAHGVKAAGMAVMGHTQSMANAVMRPVNAVDHTFQHLVHGAQHFRSQSSQPEVGASPSTRARVHVTVEVIPHIKVTARGLGALLQALKGAQVEDLGGIFTELDEDKGEAVAEHLSGLTALRRLDFSGSMHVSARTWESIVIHLRHCDNIEELSFRRCRLSDTKVRAIAGFLSEVKSIRRLDLGWNREVSGTGWSILLKALQGSQISELNFDYCLLTETKAKAIAAELPALGGTLKRSGLSIEGNYQLHADSLQMLVSKLPGQGGPKLPTPRSGGLALMSSPNSANESTPFDSDIVSYDALSHCSGSEDTPVTPPGGHDAWNDITPNPY